MFKEFIFLVLIAFIAVQTKPLDHTVQYSNEIDGGQQGDHRITQSKEIENDFDHTIPSELKKEDTEKELDPVHDMRSENNNNNNNDDDISKEILGDEIEITTTNIPTSINNSNNILSTIWDSFVHKFNFSPQMFFQDRLSLFKEVLAYYGTVLANNPVKAKQLFDGNGLIHLAGLADDGFYTNRLQPAGFLGGNGWFANKGGLLGGPGAILSTGPVLTDYPTPYRKKK